MESVGMKSLVALCILSFLFLTLPSVSASNLGSVRASVYVESTCSMSATVTSEHNAILVNGTYSSEKYPNGIGSTTIQTFCNDGNGYAIYAVGFTNNELGNTVLQGTGLDSSSDIITGTATNGTSNNDTSNWNFINKKCLFGFF